MQVIFLESAFSIFKVMQIAETCVNLTSLTEYIGGFTSVMAV